MDYLKQNTEIRQFAFEVKSVKHKEVNLPNQFLL